MTNCVIDLKGIKYNINVINNRDALILLLLELNALLMSAEKLEMKDIAISGFCVEQWIADVKSRLNVIEYKNEENNLKQMEGKLDTLLSNEKRTELEIEEIAKMLE